MFAHLFSRVPVKNSKRGGTHVSYSKSAKMKEWGRGRPRAASCKKQVLTGTRVIKRDKGERDKPISKPRKNSDE
jgi:hypothetical protein